MKKNQNYFQPRQPKKSPKQIQAEQRKLYSKSLKKKPKSDDAKELADKWNGYFDFAEDKLPAGSNDIGKNLYPALLKLAGLPKDGRLESKDYGNFVIDNQWDGSDATLFQHVTFKKIPKDNQAVKFLDRIYQDKGDHFTQSGYDKFVDEWHKKSYQTLQDNPLTQGRMQNYEILEEIMNSSPAWQIAKSNLRDSDQVLDRWLTLYESMNEAIQADQGIFDWAVQQITNRKHNINWIINAIDDEIKLMLAGKYSQRRKVHY